MLWQKARLNWITLGDGNSKFFHQAIQKRRNANNILRILCNNEWVDNPESIRKVFFNHYSNFFKDNHVSLFSSGDLKLSRLSEEGKRDLIREFTSKEIEAAVNSLAADKAPGPDGYNVRCIKYLWPFLKQKIEKFIQDFGESLVLPRGVNSSFIALIPKVTNPVSVKDYRPINLINSSMKILMKLLSSRLSQYMNVLIGDLQSGFMKGRQAAESIMVVKEIAHSIQAGRGKGLILKLDFEKAFDSVN